MVRKIRVKGAASGKLKGKRVGVKDSVAVAGIPICGGSHILDGFVPDDDATIVSRMLDEGAEIVATLGDGRFRAVRRGHHQRAWPDAQPAPPGVLRGRFLVRIGRGALLRLDRHHDRHRPGRLDSDAGVVVGCGRPQTSNYS